MMKKSKMNLFMATATAAVLVATVAAPVQTEAASKSFKDVPKSHVYYKEITEMSAQGIIGGYEDGTFKPNTMISRQHAAVLISRAFKDMKQINPQVANDVKSGNTYYKEINRILKAGYLAVDKNNQFNPKKEITRGEMAEALYKAYGLDAKGFGKEKHEFKDVKDPYLATVVSALYEAKITTGYEDGTFKPNESLSRAHYTVFMYRAAQAIKNTPVVEKPSTRADDLGWSVKPKLATQEAMDTADKDNTLLGGRQSNGNSYGGIGKLSRAVGMESFVLSRVERHTSDSKAAVDMLKRADKGEFVLEQDKNGEPFYLYYNFKEDRYYLGA